MSYTPTTWATGDTITATKLNKMEQGIANAGGGASGLIVCENDELNKNFNELLAMSQSGVNPYFVDVFDDSPEIYYRNLRLSTLYTDGSNYTAVFGCIDIGNNYYSLGFVSNSATGTLVLD